MQHDQPASQHQDGGGNQPLMQQQMEEAAAANYVNFMSYIRKYVAFINQASPIYQATYLFNSLEKIIIFMWKILKPIF